MNKYRSAAIFLGTAILLSGCSSGVPEESYQAALAQIESLEAEAERASEFDSAAASLEQINQALEAELNEKSDEVVRMESEYDALSQEYSLYRESMSEYEGLGAAEAEARRIEAEEVAASKAAAESKAKEESMEAASKAAEEASKQAEEEAKKGYDTGITYDQLARTPDDYEGKKVKFKGKVLQVIEGDDEIQIRLGTKDGYDNVLYCGYYPSIVKSRVLEDDTITIYGVSRGLLSYESTLGGTITIPAVWVEKIDQ